MTTIGQKSFRHWVPPPKLKEHARQGLSKGGAAAAYTDSQLHFEPENFPKFGSASERRKNSELRQKKSRLATWLCVWLLTCSVHHHQSMIRRIRLGGTACRAWLGKSLATASLPESKPPDWNYCGSAGENSPGLGSGGRRTAQD